MTLDLWLSLAAVLACLVASFFFSGSETALTASSRARMHALEKAGDDGAKRVNRLLASRERLIGGILIGNNLANTAAASLTTGVLLAIFGNAGIAYATIVVSVVVIIFSEVLPKTIAINHPDRVALSVARPVGWVVALLGPATIAVEALVRGILRLFGMRLGEGQNVLSAHDELRGAVDLLHREGGVVKADRDMLGGLLDLKELEVSDVMIHRTKMRTINADLAPDELVREVLASPYTRLPLWRGTPENIVGVLHAKDLLRALDAAGGDAARLDVEKIALEAWFVPDTTSLADQLRAFLARKTHFALVVDEYGEVMGLVTLEDILEEIVGDIKDEHDVALQGVRPQPDGSVNVDGSVPIRDLNRFMDWHLPDEEATTIAGLVIHEARTIPEAGQAFTFHGFRFRVLRKSRNRITVLRITPVEARKKPAA
ncbi:HlyC/CorC family transporter [Chelatococcus sp. SYSU_G07232]|uniref:HlyC/CorC family transporter n=1 Tax=Chelatococcus albus TaxID=3047466 RepID=A0ABT7ADJ5_9HYPH|nr:HlyC/CorC family transporter [Chelatococcus sp. SYSU_G07232]MDJ1157418.1 HlyC/CorC family transporter [Chelatococcus sp. SYSU_G07232]